MKKYARILAVVLLVALTLSLAACGSSGSSASTSTSASTGSASAGETKTYDQVTYAYATFHNIPTEEALDAVEEAINVITREKIGVEVTLMPVAIFEYVNKVSLALQGGEKIDAFQSLGNFGNCVSQDMAYDLSDIMATCAPETVELMGDELLNATCVNGVQYGIPAYKPFALTPMFLYRADIAEELGLTEKINSMTSIFDLTDILREVKAAKPDMTPLAPVQSGTIGLNVAMGDVDWLSDDLYTPKGVLIDGDMTVVDLYSSQNFLDRVNLAYTWNQEGLVMKDAATTTTTAAEAMSSGNYFAYLAAYSYPEEVTAAALGAQCGGYTLGAKILDNAYLSTGDINALTWMVASTSKVPEATLKFLNLTFTDKDIVNLIIYGIEGRDYVMNEDGSVRYPDGLDANTVPYTAQLSCGILGNFFNMYELGVSDPAALAWELEQNQNAPKSPAMGFTFDPTGLDTQYAAVTNVINQYLAGLVCGSLNPETELPKFIEALNAAGYQDILNAKQEQLDAWRAASGK